MLVFIAAAQAAAADRPAVGAAGNAGTLDNNPKRVNRLHITRPGVYENFLVDGEWVNRTLVKINADNVTLRHCEIRNGTDNAVTVYAKNVVIESCKIHHLLAGTFASQKDAHGITGQPNNLEIRNCDISYVSGDSIQFDPDRNPWDMVLVENCTMWTGPLPAAAAGFKRGERPGENAVDTKQLKANPRSRMLIRNSLIHGWGGGQIGNQSALNVKEHVQVAVVNSVLADNDICFRLRGETGPRGGALVAIRNSAIYRSKIGLRIEDAIENLTVTNLAIGDGIERKYQIVAGQPRGFDYRGEFSPPPYEQAIREGVQPQKN